jgi:hypothetical protein
MKFTCLLLLYLPTLISPLPIPNNSSLVSSLHPRSFKRFKDGIGNGLNKMKNGIASLVSDPFETVKNFAYAVTHPRQAFESFRNSLGKEKEKCKADKAECAGQGLVMAAGLLTGIGGATAATALGASAATVSTLGAVTTVNVMGTVNAYAEAARGSIVFDG